MSILHLPLKGKWFNLAKIGVKTEEYRLASEHWESRLSGKSFESLHLAWGYPAKNDSSRRLHLPWYGFVRRRIDFGTSSLGLSSDGEQDYFVIGLGQRPAEPDSARVTFERVMALGLDPRCGFDPTGVAKLHSLLVKLMGSEEASSRWMGERDAQLGAVPADLLLQSEGMDRVARHVEICLRR